MAEPITLFHTEEMQFEKKGEGKEATIMISGNAQPLNEDSRNGVRYRPDSVKKAAKSLQGVAFLFNHDSARSLGHVTKSGLTDSHLTYSADVDPEEKEYIRKVERGDIKFVSVGCMVENVQFNEEDNIYECDVKEYVELSAVTVPGFSNTSAEKEGLESAMFLANALGDKKVLQSLKEKAALDAVGKKEDSEEESPEGEGSEEAKDDDKEDEADDDDDDDEKDKDESADGDEGSEEGTEEAEAEETDEEGKEALIGKKEEADSEGEEQADEEATPEERITELENKVSELESKNDEFENRLAIAESKIDTLNEEEGAEDVDTPDESEEGEELEPNKEETFTSKHGKPCPTKESIANKKKSLEGDESEGKDIVDISANRKKIRQY